jgi:hypothetical protein
MKRENLLRAGAHVGAGAVSPEGDNHQRAERLTEKGEHMEEKDLNGVDNIEVEPLSDEDLDSVAGGSGCDTASCSGSNCSNGALQDSIS